MSYDPSILKQGIVTYLSTVATFFVAGAVVSATSLLAHRRLSCCISKQLLMGALFLFGSCSVGDMIGKRHGATILLENPQQLLELRR